MAFRTIIAFMRSQSEAPRIMAAANLLAKTTDNAHIIGLYTIPSPMVYADPTGFADATLFEAHEKHHKENSERISALFATEMKKSSISHEFRIIRSQHASPSSGVTHSALRADIIVAGQPDPKPTRGEVWRHLLNMRKAGTLPKLGAAKSKPPEIAPEDRASLKEMLGEDIGRRDRLPYSDRFDQIVDQFNRTQPKALSPHLVWRLVATLAK